MGQNRTLPEGYSVAHHHVRRRTISVTEGQTLPHGGATVTSVLLGKAIVAVGYAYCKDNETYNKTLGRNISEGRALKALAIQDNMLSKRGKVHALYFGALSGS